MFSVCREVFGKPLPHLDLQMSNSNSKCAAFLQQFITFQNSKALCTLFSCSPIYAQIHTLMVISYIVATATLGQNDRHEAAIQLAPPGPLTLPAGKLGATEMVGGKIQTGNPPVTG